MEDFVMNHLGLLLGGLIVLIILISLVASSMFTVEQGTVAVITRFGEFKYIASAGLNFKSPFFDTVNRTVSLQNRTIEIEFQAVTQDQANVYFKALLLYSVFNNQAETIRNVAFKFASDKEFSTALARTIEGAMRSFISAKRQAEVLTLRKEIVEHVKLDFDKTLEEWGYHLLDLQINDITFDKEIMNSMSKVVASSNLKAAAENEGQALLIQKTKAAEAEGNYIKIQAEAEKTAAKSRGEGVAAFREAVAAGITESAKQLKEEGIDVNVIMFSMWTEAIKNFAEVGKGNVIFLDGSANGMEQTMRQMNALNRADKLSSLYDGGLSSKTNGDNAKATEAVGSDIGRRR